MTEKSPRVSQKKPKRKYRTMHVGATVRPLLSKEMRKRGFAVTEVVTRWADIVGASLATHTQPQKLTFTAGRGDGGTLTLKVAPGHAPAVSHMSPMIIERINTYFGHGCVAKLKLIQGPLPIFQTRVRRSFESVVLPKAIHTKIAESVTPVKDHSLRETLSRLGHLVHARRLSKDINKM